MLEATQDGALAQVPLGWQEILRWPLPYGKEAGLRFLLRGLALFSRRQIRAVYGLEHIKREADPFILVANHSSRREALLVPGLLAFYRGGELIHFLADWNFRLIPGVGWAFRRGQVITVAQKDARPRFLNALKPLFTDSVSPFERARQYLDSGSSVGIFPEGTVNRDPWRLLTGHVGAARLSLESGVPILPIGIRYLDKDPARASSGAMEIHIGAPLPPQPLASAPAPFSAIRDCHKDIMSAISRLSGKTWNARRRGEQQ